MAPSSDRASLFHPAALWGVCGVVLVLGQAIFRLSQRAASLASGEPLSTLHWVLLIGTLIFFAYTEGWRGFHLRFSPRVVARAKAIPQGPLWVWLLAPAVCMGLVWATRRRLIASWALITMIVVLILGVRRLPFPWREIVDAGVVVGLSVGLASLLWHLGLAVRGQATEVDPDLPEGALAS